MPCTHSDTCALYPMFALEQLLAIWQQRYCHREGPRGYARCARLQLAVQARPVPRTLLPNGSYLPVLAED